MAEDLGSAVLTIRSDDRPFTAGVDKAELRASNLGKTLDATSGSALGLADQLAGAANSGDRGAAAFLKAGAAIEALAVAQAQAKAEIGNAKANLEAATISQEAYNRQVLESKAALALFEDEHRRAQTELRGYLHASNDVTGATAGQKAGLMQLTQQLGDMSTMYSLGMRPQQIFASQIGQVTGAVQLMAGEGSAFARFLGGPWGLAVTGAIMVLGPFVGQLFETRDAMADVKAASNGLSDAQGVLGQMFDLTTGKLKNQNEMLRLNAQLMAINLRAQAMQQRASSEDAMRNFQSGNLGLSMGQKVMGALGFPVSDAMERNNQVRTLLRQYQAKQIDSNVALRAAEKLDFSGLAITKQEFMQAISDGIAAPMKEEIAGKIEKSLSEGVLDPALRQDGSGGSKGGKTSGSGKTAAEIEADYQKDLDGLAQEELQARLQMTSSAEDRADIALEMLAADRAEREREIKANTDYSDAQKKALIAQLDKLYALPVSKDGTITVDQKPGLLVSKVLQDQAEQEARLGNDMLARQAAALDAWAQLAPTAAKRAELEAQSLELQQQIQRNLLEQQIANGQIADADKARALLASQQAAAQEGARRQNAGPLEVYVTGLQRDRAETGTLVQGLIVDELNYVHQTITDSIADRLGVKDPLLKGLIAMFVQQQLILPIAQALQAMMSGIGGGGGGIFGAILGGIGSLFGGGGAGNLSSLISPASSPIDVSGLLNNSLDLGGNFAGMFANGGTIGPGQWGLAGEAGIEPVFGGDMGASVMSNPDARNLFGGMTSSKPGSLQVSVSGARGNAEIEEMVRSGVSEGLAAYDGIVGDRVQENIARYG